MTIHQSEAAKGRKPIPNPLQAGEVVSFRETFTVPADIVEGDIIELVPLPNGCVLVDAILDVDDLDTGTPAIVLDVGVMSGNWGDTAQDRTNGDELFDGITTAQAGGVARPTLATAFRIAATTNDRSIGVTIVTDAATAAAGVIGLRVFYTAAG
jgi:hypothetical protein